MFPNASRTFPKSPEDDRWIRRDRAEAAPGMNTAIKARPNKAMTIARFGKRPRILMEGSFLNGCCPLS
jgi:hypothetical protein